MIFFIIYSRNLVINIQNICFKAAEKAIKSAIISKDFKILGLVSSLLYLFSVNITDGHDELEDMCREFDRIIVNVTSTRYPSSCKFPKTPRETFTQKQANEAVAQANSITQYVQNNFFDVSVSSAFVSIYFGIYS